MKIQKTFRQELKLDSSLQSKTNNNIEIRTSVIRKREKKFHQSLFQNI